MKDRLIWIIIGAILVIGIAVTCYTNSFTRAAAPSVEAADTAAGMETAPEETAAGSLSEPVMARNAGAGQEQETEAEPEEREEEQTDSLPDETEAEEAEASGEDRMRARSLPETTAEGSESASETAAEGASEDTQLTAEASGEAEVLISPLDGGNQPDQTDASDFKQRLANLDSQIQRMRAESQDETAYSRRAAAETEYRLWDNELNYIYGVLREQLSAEDEASLVREERDWLSQREAKAVEADQNGGPDSAGYAVTMAAMTRERAYELADRCEAAQKNESQPGEK